MTSKAFFHSSLERMTAHFPNPHPSLNVPGGVIIRYKGVSIGRPGSFRPGTLLEVGVVPSYRIGFVPACVVLDERLGKEICFVLDTGHKGYAGNWFGSLTHFADVKGAFVDREPTPFKPYRLIWKKWDFLLLDNSNQGAIRQYLNMRK